jgi:hypothetical protein
LPFGFFRLRDIPRPAAKYFAQEASIAVAGCLYSTLDLSGPPW